MALIETGMYSNAQAPDYWGNFSRGLLAGQQYKRNKQDLITQAEEAKRARREQEEADRLNKTMTGLMQVNDTTTPEGQMGLVRDLNRLGYGKQAMGLMAQFQQMAPKAAEYDFREDATGLLATPKNDPTKAVRVPGFTPKPANPATPAAPRFENGDDGYVHEWDPVAKKWNRTNLRAPKNERLTASETQHKFTNIRNTRKDFEDNDFVKMIPKTARYYNSAEKAFADYDTAPPDKKQGKRQFTDQALVYSFNKLMEETSAVMPGEFERTAMGQSVSQDIINKIRSGLGGGLKLDDNQRRAMLSTMKIFKNGVIEGARPAYQQFRDLAAEVSPDNPDRVVGSYRKFFEETDKGASPTAPAKGPDPKSITKPDEEEEYQAWKKSQGH